MALTLVIYMVALTVYTTSCACMQIRNKCTCNAFSLRSSLRLPVKDAVLLLHLLMSSCIRHAFITVATKHFTSIICDAAAAGL
jgi:hypothetical protein